VPLTAVVLLGDEIPVPAQDSVGIRDGCDLTQHLSAKRLGESGETAPLRIGQVNAPAELLQEEAVLGLEVLDCPLLVASDPRPEQRRTESARVALSSKQPVPNTLP
jgi:hypothetical protein